MAELEFTDDQTKIIDEFMTEHPGISRETAQRFLMGRKFDKERADLLYKNYQSAVTKYHFEAVTVADVLDELRTQKMYISGSRDRNGAALFIINAGKHVPGVFPNEQTLKLAFYLGEVVTANPKTQKNGITLISNMEHIEWANFDNVFQRTVIDFFQNNVPARVKNILLYKPPWWISMIVKMISPFLKEKMRNRIKICHEDELHQFIDHDQLPTELGGSFVYDHESFIRRESAKVPSALLASRAAANATARQTPAAGPTILPPGTVLLVSDEVAKALQEERAKALAELGEKIKIHRESIKVHSMAIDFPKLLQTRAGRLSVDLGALPTLEPNIIHARPPPEHISSIAERPGESYEREQLERRIEASMREDQARYQQEHGQATADGKSIPTETEDRKSKKGGRGEVDFDRAREHLARRQAMRLELPPKGLIPDSVSSSQSQGA